MVSRSHLNCVTTLRRIAAEGFHQAMFSHPIVEIVEDEIATVEVQRTLDLEALEDVFNTYGDVSQNMALVSGVISLFPESSEKDLLVSELDRVSVEIEENVIRTLERLRRFGSKSPTDKFPKGVAGLMDRFFGAVSPQGTGMVEPEDFDIGVAIEELKELKQSIQQVSSDAGSCYQELCMKNILASTRAKN